MWKIRTTPVQVGETPYEWNIPSVYQCTWYSYYRALQVGFSAPCYWDRATKTGSYANAKEWLKNFREPWEVKGLDYQAVAGDIVVYDGQYGHVQFMETDTMYSQYSSGNKDSFKNGKLEDYKGIKLGYLHYPLNSVLPVERNTSVNQIQTTDTGLRIRTRPSLNAEVVGQVQLGYYNVLETKENDGYTWYKLANNRWCASVTTIYLPSEDTDIVKEIERYFNSMKDNVNALKEDKNNLEEKMRQIHSLSEVKNG